MRERQIGKDELVDQLEVEESQRRRSNRRRWRSCVGRAASGVWRLLRASDLLGAAMELQRLRASGRGAAATTGERRRSGFGRGEAQLGAADRPAGSGDEERDEREGEMAGSTQKTVRNSPFSLPCIQNSSFFCPQLIMALFTSTTHTTPIGIVG